MQIRATPNDAEGNPHRQDARRRLRVISIVTASGLIGLLAALLVALLVVWMSRPRLPELTRPRFDQARRRWNEFGPASYDIAIRVTGRQAADYRVEVRGGEVISAQRNGQPLTQRRTMGTWSVEGMFGTIGSDVQNVEKSAAGAADKETPRLTLSAEFHPQYGYPRQYLRLQWGSSNPTVSWQVTEFSVYGQ